MEPKRYIGVGVNPKNKSRPFYAQVTSALTKNKKVLFVGSFSDYHDAADAYNQVVVQHTPEAKINIIDRSKPVPEFLLEKIEKGSEPRYVGVTIYNTERTKKPFAAFISGYGNKKQVHIGYYSDYHDAAEAYNRVVLMYNPKAKLNIIDREMQIPKSYLRKLAIINRPPIIPPPLSIPESIQLIKSNTTEVNNSDNKALIMYLSGRKDGIKPLIRKYHFYWLATIRSKNTEYAKSKIGIKRKFSEFTYNENDIISESVLRILNAVARGRFDGRKFKQWSTQVVRTQMLKMWNDEIKRRVEVTKSKIQDFDYEAAWATM